MKLALIGAGNRGMTYARYALNNSSTRITAIADTNPAKLENAARELGVAAKGLFTDAQELLSRPKLADAVIIASLDRSHYSQAIAALDAGYDILLEKPISNDAEECIRIAEKARKTRRRVVVCHVLRYSPFYREIKNILDSWELGRVMNIQHNENVGNFHMAHSFVRGNWRDSNSTSPIIMQKSCHDLDLLTWYAGSPSKYISSFGSLGYFKSENAPEGAAMRCKDCRWRESCRFSCYLCYEPCRGEWPATVLTDDQSEAGLRKALDLGPYGRCVFHCDNDVCDRQTANIEFKNGVTATFNLSAFTDRICRTTKIMCENGELRANEYLNQIETVPFSSNANSRRSRRIVYPEKPSSGHSGGDAGLMDDFLALIRGEKNSSQSDIYVSLESHMMAVAAERSRVGHSVVDMDLFRNELS